MRGRPPGAGPPCARHCKKPAVAAQPETWTANLSPSPQPLCLWPALHPSRPTHPPLAPPSAPPIRLLARPLVRLRRPRRSATLVAPRWCPVGALLHHTPSALLTLLLRRRPGARTAPNTCKASIAQTERRLSHLSIIKPESRLGPRDPTRSFPGLYRQHAPGASSWCGAREARHRQVLAFVNQVSFALGGADGARLQRAPNPLHPTVCTHTDTHARTLFTIANVEEKGRRVPPRTQHSAPWPSCSA